MTVDLHGAPIKAEWDDKTDPETALYELVEQGYDPDDEYVVGSTHGGIFTEVFRGTLHPCLQRAAELGQESYHVVIPAHQVALMPRTRVH